MTATDELRKLLDERGVEHYDGTESTLWGYEPTGEGVGVYRYSADEIGGDRMTMRLYGMTPEQAIGRVTECGERSAHEGEPGPGQAVLRAAVRRAAGDRGRGGEDVGEDGTMSTIEASRKLRECAEHGRAGFFANLEAAFGVPRYWCGNHVVEPDNPTVFRAMADEIDREVDELVATLGIGECTPHGKWESISQTQEVRHVFCDCGYELGMDERDSWPFESTRLFAMPNYCQECGRRIRKRVVER